MANVIEAGEQHASLHYPPPPPPQKDLPALPGHLELSPQIPNSHGNPPPPYEPAFPPRTTSIPQAPNFSRPGARVDSQQSQENLQSVPPTRYGNVRKSSGVHPMQQLEVNTRSQSSSAPSSDAGLHTPPVEEGTPDTGSIGESSPPTHTIPRRPVLSIPSADIPSASAEFAINVQSESAAPSDSFNDLQLDLENLDMGTEPGPTIEEEVGPQPQLQYFHQPYEPPPVPEIHGLDPSTGRPKSTLTATSSSNSDGQHLGGHRHQLSVGGSPSPSSSPIIHPQGLTPYRHSPNGDRPQSYIDLLQTPYAQQVAPTPNMDNSFLRNAVGSNASLLDSRKTLEMYRANVKKTHDSAVQYEFAIFMVQLAKESPDDAEGNAERPELLREARSLLRILSDRSYPFAQYYLADGYASGLFNKGKEDYERAFPLFVAASKRGHAESGYRSALCYEFGWGCRKDYAKAVKFYEMAASKNHPGAATRLGKACLESSMGLHGQYRQGLKWLKRATDAADTQYNSAPYELARLHENGYGEDVFKDEVYAAQLYTKSANLGHPEANLVMGKTYELGLLMCPKDAGLSIHFYNAAAQAGLPEAMMALCAWYLFGAEPLLEKDESEAYEWAKRAAEMSYAKAEYAVGYFKESGIGCKQDSLEANMWYWRAAQQGEERAKQRMAVIQQAVSGGGTSGLSSETTAIKSKRGLLSKLGKKQ